MRFRCERNVLANAVGAATRSPAKGSYLPVLQCVQFALAGDNLSVTGTDLELTIQMGVTVDGVDDGKAIIPMKPLKRILRALKSRTIDVTTTDDECVIEADSSRFAVRLGPADEWPKIKAPDSPGASVSGKKIAVGLHRVIGAASANQARPILSGVLLERCDDDLRLVATNSFWLALTDVPGLGGMIGDRDGVLVPARALGELVRHLDDGSDVDACFDERQAAFTVGRACITTRLIEGQFPQYRSLIPKSQSTTVTVDRKALYDIIRRVVAVAETSTNIVRLAFSENHVDITVTQVDVGNSGETLQATVDGPDLTVGLNPTFTAAVLNSISGEKVTIGLTNPLQPITIRDADIADDTGLHLLMPIRLS